MVGSPQAMKDPWGLCYWVIDGWMDGTVKERTMFCKEFNQYLKSDIVLLRKDRFLE